MRPPFTGILCRLDYVLILKNSFSEVCKGVYMNSSYFLEQMNDFRSSIIIAGPRHGTKQEIGAPYAFKS